MSLIRGGDSHIYSAMYNSEEVIVKSIPYGKKSYQTTSDYKDFLNFINEEVSVAYFIDPGVEVSDDQSLTVTMSAFAKGVDPKKLGPDAPWSWIYEEAAVKTLGEWWGKFRTQSIAYKNAYPVKYGRTPAWDTKDGGWQSWMTPPEINVTKDSYGVIHSDAHTGNTFIDYNGHGEYDMTVIDFDNSQKSWYIIDLGTITWAANM